MPNDLNMLTLISSILMDKYINMIGLKMRITSSSRSLPVGVGVARVREKIERAKMAFRETENFIVSSTLFIASSWVLKCTSMEPPALVITVSELPKIKVEQ